jgi:hypothetical protein
MWTVISRVGAVKLATTHHLGCNACIEGFDWIGKPSDGTATAAGDS